MDLDLVITQLRARCSATFGQRVAGAAEFKVLQESATLQVPCAFVIPLDDSPGESNSQNSVRQTLTDSFAVVVAVSNVADEKGHGAQRSIHAIRALLWRALLGWQPIATGEDESRYDGIVYEGGSLLTIDRARLWYQFEFGAPMEIEPSDGYQEVDLEALPDFLGATLRVDAIDPMADPNLQSPGPDGRIEHTVRLPKTGDFPT